MEYLDYYEGYRRALTDLARWINHPIQPLDPRLCKARHLDKILVYIAAHVDDFMPSPDSFGFTYSLEKGKLKIIETEGSGSRG